jgi:hypothetical protein
MYEMKRFAVFAVTRVGCSGWEALVRTLAALCLMAGLASPALAARIGFDARNAYDANDNFATGANFDELRTLITGLGHTIVPVASFDAASLAAANIQALYLNQTFGQSGGGYSASEISAIQGFVGAGNGLVLNADGGAGLEVASMNSLASAFGVSFNATPTEPDGHEILSFVSHPVTAGLGPLPGTGMCVSYQRTLTVGPPAKDLTTLGPTVAADNALAAVGTTAGAPGNVVITSDATAFEDSDVSPKESLACDRNAVLARNIVNFVVPVPEPGTFAMFGLGLAVLGSFARSRHRC